LTVRLSAPERRTQLLSVAIHRFGTHGYHLTTMNQLADAAGVTKPVLYQHFRSKRELFLAVLDDVGNRLRSSIVQAAANANGPHAQVEAGFAAYFGFFATQPAAFAVLFGDAARNDDAFAAESRRVEETLAESIAELIVIGTDATDRRLLAFGIVGLAEGACRSWVHGGLDLVPDRLARRMADLVWYGLRGQPPASGAATSGGAAPAPQRA
jgi:AcrR family transcriptional regulator